MLIFFFISLILFISFFLYCMIHCTNSYDSKINDDEQMQYIIKYKDSSP